MNMNRVLEAAADQGFPTWGRCQPQRKGAPTYYLGKFYQILHVNEENRTERERTRPKFYYLDPSL